MKFGALREYCLELSLTNFGRDPRRSGSGSASRNFVFVFCPLNNARFHRLPVGQISRNFHKKTCFRMLCGGLGNICENLPVRGLFPPKNLHYGLIKVNDFRLPAAISPKWLNLGKSWQVGMPVDVSTDTVGMNSKWFACMACNARTRRAIFPQKYSSTTSIREDFTACCITQN